MIYLAKINTVDGKKYIIGLSIIQDNEMYDQSLYMNITSDVYEYLKDKVSAYVNETASTAGYYVLDNITEITNIEDIKYDEFMEQSVMASIKQSYKSNMFSITTNVYKNIVGLFSNIIEYNNRLIEKGICITEANKQEKYNLIIEMDDLSVIEAYLLYNEAKERLDHYNNYFKNYSSYEERIDNATSAEELNEIFNELSSNYS